ncbi:hypothetical protein RIF29_40326 [Crotalaria pallida]|uniref:Nucleotidyl transferase domain-containing protein n=1 Tax=Crotalaria pallida TaxID=3830 RepID=A0AAN9E3G7_CROPI
MDYMELVQKHIDSCADISVSCLPVNGSRASDFGLVKVDERGRIRQFLEKPNGELLRSKHVDTSVFGLSAQEAREFPYIASMGIYVFKIDVLIKLLSPEGFSNGSNDGPKSQHFENGISNSGTGRVSVKTS